MGCTYVLPPVVIARWAGIGDDARPLNPTSVLWARRGLVVSQYPAACGVGAGVVRCGAPAS